MTKHSAPSFKGKPRVCRQRAMSITLQLDKQTLQVHKADPRFPIGRTRLETVGVVSCAVIMTLATIEVSIKQNWDLDL